jgi:hypothetical protein
VYNQTVEATLYLTQEVILSTVPSEVMERLRPSAMIIKRNRDRGSPCLIPCMGEKGQEGTPLMRIEKKAEEVRFRIQLTQEESKPNAKRTERM